MCYDDIKDKIKQYRKLNITVELFILRESNCENII